jgi:RHS repeat-associated protein
MNRLATILALLSMALVPLHARAAPYCPDTNTSLDCKGDKTCKCSDIMVGDPVNLADGSTFHRVEDLPLGGELAPDLAFLRTYDSEVLASNHGGELTGVPKPFGSSPSESGALHWSHNFFAFVYKPASGNWWVRNLDGRRMEFLPCNGFWCMAPNPSSNSARQHRLEWTPEGFTLHELGGRRLYFYAPFGSTHYFLTEVVSADNVSEVRLTYHLPTVCPGFSAAPYLDRLETAHGLQLSFEHRPLVRRFSSTVECVLSRVSAVSAGGGTPGMTVTYAYTRDADGVERPGLIQSATWSGPADSKAEQYIYQGGFGVYRDGFWLMRHAEASGVTYARSIGEEFTVTWDATSASCDPSSACCGGLMVRQVSSTLFDGGGSSSVGTMASRYELTTGVGFTGGRLYRRVDSCSVPNACSAGDLRQEWECPANSSLRAEKGFKNKRGYWEVHTNALPPVGQPPQLVERLSTARGATSLAGTDALEVKWMTWAYPVYANQRLRTESVPSVLGTSSADRAVVTHRYDNRGLKIATYQRGWTRDINGNSIARVVATFFGPYRYPWACGDGQADPKGRNLVLAGPCEVVDENAQYCQGASFPVTLYHYWRGEPEFNRLHNLKKEVRYPNGCASQPLETTYEQYDASGQATRVVDANGVATEYVYGVSGILSMSVGGGPATTHGYDNGALAWVRYPQGNYEVFCHRRNTPTAACTGGQWHPLVQWKARSDRQDGATWSEKVLYAYWGGNVYPDDTGPLKSETFVTATGEVRRVVQYAVDAQERLTHVGWGSEVNSLEAYYKSPSSYDGADNLTGTGHPANDAPAWCGGTVDSQTGLPRSRRCDALQHDRANRLESLVEYTSDNSSEAGVKTCFVHDPQGNIKTIVPQCQTNLACTLADGSLNPTLPAECLRQAQHYQFDDFGNRVEFSSPNGLNPGQSTRTFYTFNALGQLSGVATERMRSVGARMEYTTDPLGRRTRTAYWDGTSWKTLYQFYYDRDGANPPPGCASPTYTLGRLRLVVDSGGSTWYSHDMNGRLLRELRVRPGATSCSEVHSESNPHITYTYTPNGHLASMTYPHGRRVSYLYPSDLSRVDRVESIAVSMYVGNPLVWTPHTLVSHVSWEPYGGLRGYRMQFPATATTASVEYLLGDDAGTVPAAECPSAPPSQAASDRTGRLRALWVSSGAWPLGSGTGDIYKRTYTWRADQVSRIQTCLRNAPSQTELFDYDRLLRLMTARTPAFASTGGAYQQSSADYDTRGNRTRLWVDDAKRSFNYEYAGDRLLNYSSNRLGTRLQRNYGYSGDGQIMYVLWPTDSSGTSGRELTFTYDTNEQSAGNLMAFRTVQVGNASFDYWYDAYGRRRMKVFPTQQTQEFFYDSQRHLLEDRGIASLGQSAPYPLDEYVWLDGRPLVMVCGSLDAGGNRRVDGASGCQSLGQQGACNIYFIVSDHIGKPVLMLDGAGRITGTGEYSPFGELNRVETWGETPHPYVNHAPRMELARVSQPTLGLSMEVRLRFDMLDTERCGISYYDPVYVHNGSTNAVVAGPYGGHHQGEFVSPWLSYPASSFLTVSFQADSINWAPDGSGCASGSYTSTFPYEGVALRSYEYRRYEGARGATPMWTPLRFPGQYHDPETDLLENWNRYYDPSTGRYLQPEPLLASPTRVHSMALRGMTLPAYAYAANNPLAYTDVDGRIVTVKSTPLLDELYRKLESKSCGRTILRLLKESAVHFIISQDDSLDSKRPGMLIARTGSDGNPDEVLILINSKAEQLGGTLFSLAHELGHALDYRRGIKNRTEHYYSPSCFQWFGKPCSCRVNDPRDYAPREEWADRVARCVTEGSLTAGYFVPKPE